MKTLNFIPIMLAVLMLALVRFGFAGDGKYEEAMKKGIAAVYSAQSIDDLQKAVNTFERIGEAEKTYWEPHYYAAFGYVLMATRENDGSKKDSYLDQALQALEKAKNISGEDSEVVTIEGFVHTIRVTVDPAARGPQYASLAMQTLGKAVGLNAENPRALALMAQMQYGTAQFFGSSTIEACETITKALEKFDNFKSDNPLAPRWGRPMAESLKAQCK
jgi:hypothetical protein